MYKGSAISPTDLEHARITVEMHLPENRREMPRKERGRSRYSRNGEKTRCSFPVIQNSTLTRQQFNGTAVVGRTIRGGEARASSSERRVAHRSC